VKLFVPLSFGLLAPAKKERRKGKKGKRERRWVGNKNFLV